MGPTDQTVLYSFSPPPYPLSQFPKNLPTCGLTGPTLRAREIIGFRTLLISQGSQLEPRQFDRTVRLVGSSDVPPLSPFRCSDG